MLLADPGTPLGSMPAYGTQHLAAVAVIVLAGIVLVPLARRYRGTGTETRVTRAVGWMLLIVSASWTLWGLAPAHWDVQQSLPLHYSDALRYITAIALICRPDWAIAICYFWGLTLNSQSILTPDLVYRHVRVLEFLEYWFAHGSALLVAVILVWGLGYRPTWRGYAVAFAAAAGWAGIAMSVNAVLGTNYGYLSRAPEGPSLLDVLGGWPVYVLWELVLVASVWALMTWPWVRLSRRGLDRPMGARGLLRRLPARVSARTVRADRLATEAPAPR